MNDKYIYIFYYLSLFMHLYFKKLLLNTPDTFIQYFAMQQVSIKKFRSFGNNYIYYAF